MGDEFLFRIPVWAIVNIANFQAKGLLSSIVTAKSPEVSDFLLMFTDDDLAKRFIEDNQASGCAPVEIKTEQALRSILIDLKKNGLAHVGIDVSNSKGRFYPIGDIIDTIKGDNN